LSPGNVGKYTNEMKPETRQRLKDFFQPYNDALRDLVGWGHDLDAGWLETRPALKPTWSSLKS